MSLRERIQDASDETAMAYKRLDSALENFRLRPEISTVAVVDAIENLINAKITLTMLKMAQTK